MKQTTLKNLLLVIFCSLTLSTIPQNLAETSVKGTLEGDIAENELKLSIDAKYKLGLSEDKASTFQHLNFKMLLSNPLSNKVYEKIIQKAKDEGIVSALKVVPSKLVKKATVETNPITFLHDKEVENNKELIIKLGVEKPKFCPKPAIGVNFSFAKLPYCLSVGLGGYASIDDLTAFQFPIKLAKKGLLSEEDSVNFNTAFSLTRQYYGSYIAFLDSVLSRFAGVDIAYKTGSKESVLNSIKLSCSTLLLPLENKPMAKVAFNLNGSPLSDLHILSSVYNMLPEKSQELCGSLDSMSLSVTHHFTKNTNANHNQGLAGMFEHVTLGCECNFKDLFHSKDTELQVGFNLKVRKPQHETRFKLILTFGKEFDLV